MCCAGSSTQAVIYSRHGTRIDTFQLNMHGAQPPVPLTHLRPDFRVRVSKRPSLPGSHSIQFATPHFVSRTLGDEGVELFIYAALQDIASAASETCIPANRLVRDKMDDSRRGVQSWITIRHGYRRNGRSREPIPLPSVSFPFVLGTRVSNMVRPRPSLARRLAHGCASVSARCGSILRRRPR
ncbi:hypothetical protein BDW22DRAFT_978667 [Trametopsis cervina]|nr:hypothetical protein BDW22DRAFT_1039226 [Trametopsis cervina]KAI0337115.1 hypothetical protein BDW22DRAFT_978667 [Trametopsis cervina]